MRVAVPQYYHSDPHAGNLLRTASGDLAYIDFGMMGEIEPSIRRGLIQASLPPAPGTAAASAAAVAPLAAGTAVLHLHETHSGFCHDLHYS